MSEMSKKQRALVIRARAKLYKFARDGHQPCDPACPGWALIESDSRGEEIERCDDCWAGIADKLTDEEAAALPEAKALLAETLRGPLYNIASGGSA